MRLAWRELRRQPGRFIVAGLVLSVLALLLMFLGGLLDGLLASSTGAYRAQPADLIVYSTGARDALPRSRIDGEARAAVEAVEGVGAVGGWGSVQLGARPGDEPDSRDLLSTALLGYELAPRGLPATPPAAGTVIADSSAEAEGVAEGDTLLLGPQRTPVQVVGFVDDTRFSGQFSLWGSLETWREVVKANRPDQTVAGDVVQALVVQVDDDADPAAVATAIEEATAGATSTLTKSAAIEAIPGVSQQRATFNQIIGITALIAVIVVALFFALITVERLALYGILKAIGASSATLFGGVTLQAVVIAASACAVGAAASIALDAVIPPGSVPFAVTTGRLLTSVGLMLLAAVVGTAFSLRRLLRVDPASAIGTGT